VSAAAAVVFTARGLEKTYGTGDAQVRALLDGQVLPGRRAIA
jgi:hypothetical protein